MITVQITRSKQYRSRLYQGPGPEWKWIYYLPPVTEVRATSTGTRIVTNTPGGFSTKAETLDLVRRNYSQRPLTVQWPDGKSTEIKR